MDLEIGGLFLPIQVNIYIFFSRFVFSVSGIEKSGEREDKGGVLVGFCGGYV